MLGTALVPPDGYELDGLIAATYSLDLPMALALPLAVLREGELAGESFENATRIDIYDSAGSSLGTESSATRAACTNRQAGVFACCLSSIRW